MKKKKYYIIGLVIVFLVLALVGYFYNKRVQAYSSHIHQKTNGLYKVNTYEIVAEIMSNRKNLDSITSYPIFQGLDIPTHIFFYTVKGKESTTLFGSLGIKDYALFDYEANLNYQVTNVNDKIKSFTTKDQKITTFYNEERIAVSYSWSREKTSDILSEIVLNENMIPVGESSLKQILGIKGQFTFYDGENEGYLNLENDQLLGKFLVNNAEKIPISEKIQSPEFDKNNIVSFWYEGNMNFLPTRKIYSIGESHLSTDSIAKNNLREIQLEMSQPIIHKDSIITYDFDDNFEKVEKWEVRDVYIPGLSVKIKSNSEPLYNYLESQGIIADKDYISDKVFPLYPLRVFKEKEALVFTTYKKAEFSPITNSNSFLYLFINFKDLQKQEGFSSFSKYMEPFSVMEVKGQKEENKIYLDLNIKFRNTQTESPVYSLWKIAQ